MDLLSGIDSHHAAGIDQPVEIALDILADIFTNSVLDEDELERERDVILQEISAAHDQPELRRGTGGAHRCR